MRIVGRVILTVFLLLFMKGAFSGLNELQNYKNWIKKLSIEDGLSHNHVTSIVQDSRGFIWIGTQFGLHKFNGYTFEEYQYEIDDETSLTNSFVRNLLLDSDGNLWVATWGGGINRYDEAKHRFTNFSARLEADSIRIHDHIECILEATGAIFWFCTLDGLVRYDAREKSASLFRNDPGDTTTLSDNWVVQALETSSGEMLFLCVDGVLHRFDEKSQTLKRYWIPHENQQGEINPVSFLMEDSAGNVLAGTKSGLFRFDISAGKFFPALSEKSRDQEFAMYSVTHLYEPSPGILLVGTEGNGLYELQRDAAVPGKYMADTASRVLADLSIREIFRDKQGNIWVGTGNQGLRVILNKKKRFRFLDRPSEVVSSVTKGNGDYLWVGTNSGLYQCDFSGEVLQRHTVHSGLSSNKIRSLYLDGKERLLIGTENGLDVLDIKSGDITLWREGNNILNTPIVTITQDTDGNFWMGSDTEGLIFINGKTGEVSNYKAGGDAPRTGIYSSLIGNYNVTSICFETEEKLWVGIYGGGVNLFDIEKRAFFHRYLFDPDNPHSLNDNNVLDIYRDRRGTLWVGTLNGGLNRFDPDSGKFEAYLKKDGLPSNNVCNILEDDSGVLWLGTNSGLARFNIQTKEVRYYDTTDGLLSNHLLPKAGFTDAGDRIYLGTSKGVNFFQPEAIGENTDEPDLILTGLKLFNQSVAIGGKKSPLQKHISLTDSIVLKYDQTALTIEYVGLNYISSQKNRYAFMMEGLEDEWRYVGNQRAAHYSNLPPGRYTFKVKASNNDDVWTSEPAALHIAVLPPPWRSNTAYIIYILLFFSINVFVIWFVKWVNKRQHDMELARLERKKEKQVAQFRMQFFTNISHELRTHLSLIIFPVNKLLSRKTFPPGEKNELERIDLNAKRLLKLTDEIIDFRRVEQGKAKLELKEADVVSFIRQIKKLFKSLADEHGIRFRFLHEQPEIRWGFDQEKLTKILFNLLSNAFKYTPDGGSIAIYARVVEAKGRDSAVLRIGVKDSGIGIDAEILPQVFDRFFNPGKDHKQHGLHDSSGIGLALVKQLVELHGGTIDVESTKGKGSHFYFDLIQQQGSEEKMKSPETISPFFEYEKWEEMLRLERSNFQDEFPHDHKFKSRELPSILIVDDNREICQALAEMLGDSYRIFAAGNGEEAFHILEKELITLVVTDIMMPVMDGITLCEKMKEDIKTSHIPVVMLTAKAGLENELEGLRTGADAYISKPFNMEKVQLTIKNLLESREKVRMYLSGKKMAGKDVPLHPLDKKLMEKIEAIVQEKMGDPDFSVDQLGAEAGLSRMHLYRKIKALTGQSPREYVKKRRLERSKELLEEGNHTVAEIAYDVGFSTPGNFSTAYRKFFGITPAQYRAGCFK